MATKYILVPEQMYKGLINIEPANIPLDFERKALSKAKSVRKTPSSKNTLVNQELRRYLKLKKDEDNKPVKVELTNGAKGIIMPNQNAPSAPSVQTNRTPNISRQSSMSTLRSRNPSSSSFASAAPVFVYTDYDEDPTLVDLEVPTASNNTAVRNKMYRLYDYIKQHPERFGIEGEKVLGRNRVPMPQSDLMRSLERLIIPSVSNMPSPVGTTYLRAAISRDPTAKNLFNEKLTPIRSTKRNPPNSLFRSETLSPPKKFSGIQKRKSLHGLGFAPKLWH